MYAYSPRVNVEDNVLWHAGIRTVRRVNQAAVPSANYPCILYYLVLQNRFVQNLMVIDSKINVSEDF